MSGPGGEETPPLPARAVRAVQRIAARIDLANTAETLRTTQMRERWLEVGQEVTTAILEGVDIEDALSLIATRLRVIAEADTACLVLPGVGDEWVIEFADGDDVGDLVGIVMPAEGRARRVISERAGMVVRSFDRTSSLRVPQFGRYGPALYAPLVVGSRSTGVIILLRSRGAPEFRPVELRIAESFARQAALALELAEARLAQDRAALLDERARIARDLHDLAIQHLFATGLSIARARESLPEPSAASLGEALNGLDEAVAQIRSIVHALQRDAIPSRPLERLHREIALARHGAGSAAELELLPSDVAVEAWADAADTDLVDDVIAVVREGLSNAARHAEADHVIVRIELIEPTDETPAGPPGDISSEQGGRAGGSALQVSVLDDGVGIPGDRTRSSGLSNLARRAERWGGRAEVGARATGGTALTWVVPTV